MSQLAKVIFNFNNNNYDLIYNVIGTYNNQYCPE